MEMKNMTIQEFCVTTASDAPAPGGGSVSALVGALSAPLAEMVASLTVGKKNYEAVMPEMQEIAKKASVIRGKLLDDITRDSTSFDGYMAALKLPKETEEQKGIRLAAMQQALKEAAAVPFAVAQLAYEIFPLAEAVAAKGNANAITDALVATMTARTAVLGALCNVKINLGAMKDMEYVKDMEEKISKLARDAGVYEQKILDTVALL